MFHMRARGSWPVSKTVHKAHRTLGRREAGDLVVNQAGGQRGVDHIGLAQRAAPALRPDHPYRTVWLDGGLELRDALEVGRSLSADEHQIARGARAADDHIRGPLMNQLDERSVVQIDNRDPGAGPYSELVEQFPQLCCSWPSPPLTRLKTITPTSQPA